MADAFKLEVFNDATGLPVAAKPRGVGGSGDIVVSLYGTFTGTYEIQSTNDGLNWVTEGAALSAPGERVINSPGIQMVRVRTTAYTSGEAVVTVAVR